MNWPGNLKVSSLPDEMGKRIGAGVLVFGCLALVAWSFTFRLSLFTEAQSRMHTPFSLSSQVDSLEQMWSDEEAATVNQEWDSAKSQSFRDYDHLMMWVSQMRTQAYDLGLNVDFRIDDTTTPVSGVQEIHHLAMDLTIQAEDPSQGYHRIIRFVKDLIENDLTMNVVLMELTGSGRGAHKMELRLQTFLQQAV